MADQLKEAAPQSPGFVLPGWENTTQLLAAIVESSEDAIVSKTLEGIVTSWNSSAKRIFGYSADEMIGQHVSKLIPKDRDGEEDFIIDRIRRGLRVEHYDTVRRRKDGQLIAISLTVSPVRDGNGNVLGASKIARDISDRKRLEEAQRLLARELNHRSKNLLAVVEAIIRQTVARGSPQDYTRRLSQRVRALSANQDLLIESSWRGAEMREVVRSQVMHVAPALESRVGLAGEPLMVTPEAAQALGMAFHELASNALVYGALSTAEGRVEVSWQLEPADNGAELIATWHESGGPAVIVPARAGFGTTIIERITGQSLGGQVEMIYAPAGLIWRLRAPASAVISIAPPSVPHASRTEVFGK